jgi:flagellar assembly protein FliH
MQSMRAPEKRAAIPADGEHTVVDATQSSAQGSAPSAQTSAPLFHSTIDEFEQRLKVEFKAGFDEGRRHTEKHLRDEITRSLMESQKKFEQLLLAVQEESGRLQSAAEKNVVRLALAIAERVTKREITIDRGFVLRQINEGVKRVVGMNRLKIRINPKDEELVREYRTNILATSDAVNELVIEADETIAQGGCIIESDSGNVDAMIATQLERIEAALMGEQEER